MPTFAFLRFAALTGTGLALLCGPAPLSLFPPSAAWAQSPAPAKTAPPAKPAAPAKAAAPAKVQAKAPAKPAAPATPPARPAAPTAGDSAPATPQAAFEALPEAERKAIQEALVWAGAYSGSLDGSFGKRTHDAILAFEKKAKLKADGILDARERKALDAAAARARAAAKFAMFEDPRNGVRIGIPGRYLDKSAPTKTGTRFNGPRDNAVLTTLTYRGAEADLPALFERLSSARPPARRVAYKLLRPDFLVVSGEEKAGRGAARRFYTRVDKAPDGGPAGLRGFTLSYAADLAPALDPIVVAVANSFEAFPAASSTTSADAAQPAADAPEPDRSEPDRPRPRPALPLPPTGRVPDSIARIPPPFLGTGLLVAPGKVLTTAALDACPEILAGKVRGRLTKADRSFGLSLVEAPLPPASGASPLRFAAEVQNGEIVAAGFAPGPAGGELIVAAGTLSAKDDRLSAEVPLQGAAAGTAVFDRTGALVGLVATGTSEPRRIAGVVPPAAYPLVGAQALAAALQTSGIAAASGSDTTRRSTGEIAAAAAPLLVPLACASPARQ